MSHQLLTSVKEDLESNQAQRDKLLRLRQFLEGLSSDTLNTLPDGYCYDGGIDFDNLSHAKVMEVVKLLPGRWTKKPSDTDARIHYTLETNGVKVRCYSGEPPPNCKIVEETYTIPARPEQIGKRRRLVCTDVIDSTPAA